MITGAATEVPRAWALELSSGPGTLAAAGIVPIRCGAAGVSNIARKGRWTTCGC
jgi:hypothetical protein